MPTTQVETTHLPTKITADTKVERVVRQLNTICKAATFDFAMAVGKLIVDSFYSGDLEAWRSRGIKNVSFRRLAKHPDLPMSATALYRSTAIYEVWQRTGAAEWKHLSTSHVRLVLPLAPGQQARLLQRAEANAWPVQRLREEIGALPLSNSASRGGRKRRPRLRKALQKLQAFLDESKNLLNANAPVVDLSPESVRSLVQLLQSVQCACTELERQVSDRLGGGRPTMTDPTVPAKPVAFSNEST
jgi:hypothetical protein